MTDETDRQVLRRMIEAGRRITRESTADAALSLAVTRAGQEVLGLTIEVPAVPERHMTLADLPEVIEDRALRLVIEGPGGGLGLMVLGVEVLSAIVQMQTIGRLCRTDTANRRPTRTDAAMAVEFVDRLLSEIERELAGSAAGPTDLATGRARRGCPRAKPRRRSHSARRGAAWRAVPRCR